MHLSNFSVEDRDERMDQHAHLVLRTIPVFGRENIDRQNFNARLDARLNRLIDTLDTL